jgi:hypothetical protein
MSGRQWHWIAAGVAGIAVVGAVLANDTTQNAPTLTAHAFPTVDFYAPDNGSMIVATPTMNATTVTKRTSTTAPKPTTSTTSASKPVERPDNQSYAPLPHVPVFVPDCSVAWVLGVAPIHRGDPGYRGELDGDHDGIACEWR